MTWRCKNFVFDDRCPVVMGVVNVTPDSFSDGGDFLNAERAVSHALELVEAGAQIIDVGGESTRPGAATVSVAEEVARVEGVVRALSAAGVCVSIDTRHAQVAQAAVRAGAAILNDVTGFRDPAMVAVAQSADVGLVVMHMAGDDPATMQDNPRYDDVVAEVCQYLKARAAALVDAGIGPDRICLDPGPGFGKTAEQTLELVRNIHMVARLGYPTMAALSRKSFIGKAYGIPEPKERDAASASESLMACELGATILRVHNVSATMATLQNVRPLAVLSLGCNVPLVAHDGEETEGKIAVLEQAIAALCSLPDSQIVDISSFYASEPAYLEEQDSFVNAVVLLRTGIAPRELLDYLHAIENSLGRVRTVKNGPRTCDIDIVDYQMYVVDNDTLTLPHPCARERDFVVTPLRELRPRFVFADGTRLEDACPTVGRARRCAGGA